MKSKILSFVFSAAALLAPASAATLDRYSPGVAKSVHQEFGGIRADYFTSARVSEQIMMGLGIPNPTRSLSDGNSLISGCRRHSCDEKSAIIATPAGTMLAAGMIYFPCSGKNAAPDCFKTPQLKLFMEKKNNRPDFVQELKDWAARVGYKGGAAEIEILPGN
jgi:hypothetical protein